MGAKNIPQLLTIPVAKSIPTAGKIRLGSYDNVRHLVEQAPGPWRSPIVFAARVRKNAAIPENDSPIRETCLQIGADHARQYVEMGIGAM